MHFLRTVSHETTRSHSLSLSSLQEAYRRWVCSTLIPFFDNVERERPSMNKTKATERQLTKGSTNIIKRSVAQLDAGPSSSSPSSSAVESKMTIVDNSSDTKKRWVFLLIPQFVFPAQPKGLPHCRSKRKSNPEIVRTRIRPCLSVCQTVEQKCPYLLPGDRAPAHPTQYAGEPTFLCLGECNEPRWLCWFCSDLTTALTDPNIPVTGRQKDLANHGPNECCYEYCANNRICSSCHFNETTADIPRQLAEESSSVSIGESNNEIEVEASPEFYADNSYPRGPAQCDVIVLLPSDGISTKRESTLPNTKCSIPYYIGPPLNKDGSVATAASSSGHRQRLQMPIGIVLLWLVGMFFSFDWPQWQRILDLRDEGTREQCDHRRWWRMPWWWSPMSRLMLLFSTIATSCCCLWHSQLFPRHLNITADDVRTLKCHLQMRSTRGVLGKVVGELRLIRNYYRIRDLTSLTRTAAQQKQTPPLLLPPPSPAQPKPPMSPSSQSPQQEQQMLECTGNNNYNGSSGRRNNSNAKTVVRWGTIDVVSQLLLRRLVCHRTYYTRILTNCCWALLTMRRLQRGWRRKWWILAAVAFGIVFICERLIYRSGRCSRIIIGPNGAFNNLHSGSHISSRKAGVREVENYRLGLITMIKT